MRHVIKILGGSVAVYIIVAACSAADSSRPNRTAGTGGTSSTPDASNEGGQSGRDGSVAADGNSILDALTDPVPDAKADPNTSGSRLRARYWVGDDGSRQFIGMRDTQLDEDCFFYPASDGVTRCLPWSAIAGVTRTGAFTSSDCTTGGDVFIATCPAQYGASGASDSGSCPARILYTIYSLQPYSGPLYQKSGTSCVTYTLSAGYSAYTGTLMQATAFVGATEQVE